MASLQGAELGVDYSSVRASVKLFVLLLAEAQNHRVCTILPEISVFSSRPPQNMI